jgi:hypothetical protein
LHLKNEEQLFIFIYNLINENKEYLILLEFINFGGVDSFELLRLVNSIQYQELSTILFEHMKGSFSFNYFFCNGCVSFSKDIECIFPFHDAIENYFAKTKGKS